jgi:DNA-binding winged helix-turn-helix (wHTH) protein/tetratricopeptide (TPR) repeat protein
MIYEFDQCVLDTSKAELSFQGGLVHVEPQVLAVLTHLLENRERMVTKIELLDEIWGDRFVSESALTSRIKLARKACGDSGRDQHVIKTVHGRGYRFVADVEERVDAGPSAPVATLAGHERSMVGAGGVVGRESELTVLEAAVQAAAAGSKAAVFVTGEPGVGKTTLVAELVERGDGLDGWFVVRGRCIRARGGQVEPYFALLDALSELSRSEPDAVRDALDRAAPTWLAQLPSLADEATAERLERRLLGSSPHRMLREGADAIEELARERAVLVLVEDLQWADEQTLDVLDLLARRAAPVRLVLIATARTDPGPHRELVDDLATSGAATHLELGGLDLDGVASLLAERLHVDEVPGSLVDIAARRSSGIPLFVQEITTAWRREHLVDVVGGQVEVVGSPEALTATIPATLPSLIERELATLADDEVALLEAASVAGSTFDGASVAAGVDRPLGDVEETLSAMARRLTHVVGNGGSLWPDGTMSTSYSFDHGVIRDVVYGRLAPLRRAQLHGRVGLALERGFSAGAGAAGLPEAARSASSTRVGELLVTLAAHFTEAGDVARAVEYGRLAGEQAAGRDAHDEAIAFLVAALGELDRAAPGADRDRAELLVRLSLGPSLVATKGWMDPAVSENYDRALALSPDSSPESAAARYGLATISELRGDFERTEELLTPLVDDEASGDLVVEALELMACSTFHQGAFERSVRNAGTVLDSWDDSVYSVMMARIAEHPTSSCNSWLSLSAWFLGRSDESLERAERAVQLAEQNRYALSTAVQQRAMLHQLRNEPAECASWGTRTRQVGGEQEFPMRVVQGDIYRGWALAASGEAEEGMRLIAGGLERFHELGARLNEAYYLGLHADALLRAGRPDDALEKLDLALAAMHRTTRAYFHESELHRLRAAALQLTSPDGPEAARAALEASLAIADERHSPALALRTVADRVALEVEHGDPVPWRRRLTPLLAVYDGQRPTPDVLRARRLLA